MEIGTANVFVFNVSSIGTLPINESIVLAFLTPSKFCLQKKYILFVRPRFFR